MQSEYLVLYQDSYYVEGDERSRTNPGHGYPAHTVQYDTYERFKTFEAFTAWVEANSQKIYYKKAFEAFKLVPISVTTKIQVEVKEDE